MGKSRYYFDRARRLLTVMHQFIAVPLYHASLQFRTTSKILKILNRPAYWDPVLVGMNCEATIKEKQC